MYFPESSDWGFRPDGKSAGPGDLRVTAAVGVWHLDPLDSLPIAEFVAAPTQSAPSAADVAPICPFVDTSFLVFATGDVHLCCWQPGPLFNWRNEQHFDVETHPKVIAVRSALRNGVVPRECASALCVYTKGRPMQTGE
jgi:hypothetical protein